MPIVGTPLKRQRGSVIIVALWTITLMTILVTVIASQNRLSAQVAWFHQQELSTWARVQEAVNRAEMELMLERMPQPVGTEEFSSLDESLEELNRNELYRFNGDALALHYPAADDIVVRIYDHAGKINLRQLSRGRLRMLLETRLGGPGVADPEQIDDLMDAWNDWLDLNDGESPRGAEKDYYQSLPTPYVPRNGPLETVEELLAIRGFAEVFGDVNLEAAFTVYGEDELVNLNVASIDTMRLLPGLNEELIAAILEYRKEKDFQGNGDVAQLIPAENMADLRQWLNSRKGDGYYTIMAYPRTQSKAAGGETGYEGPDDDTAAEMAPGQTLLTAYAETVFVPTQRERPQVLKINPYQRMPATGLLPVDSAEAH